ncbi:MAG TPA: permease-like cell division protein FtsX [Planosporangium sp.]|nr:permease-like cell division protein FtsX [Planosporangium sp.]
MSSRIREALADLEHDVAELRLDPPEAIRARGQARRRRQMVGALAAVAVGATLTGVVVLPPLYRGWGGAGGQSQQAGAVPNPSDSASVPANAHVPDGCVSPSPSASPPQKGPEPNGLYGRSRQARVFLKQASGPAEKAAVETALRTLPAVTAVDFLSQQEQWRRFAAQFCDAPDLVAATKPESLPEAFDVTLASPEDYPSVWASVHGMSGVADVVPAA